jgi:hypothetical protein
MAIRVCNKESILITGDLNEALGLDPNLMALACASLDLYDVLDEMHGDSIAIPTYARGSTRLDYTLASHSLQPHIKASGFNLFNAFYHSDHRAAYADIDLSAVLGTVLPTIVGPDQRSVSTSSATLSKFVAKAYDHLLKNKVFHQYQEFLLDSDTHPALWQPANHIDSLLRQAILCAERRCRRKPRPPWSEKLHLASLKVRYWRTALTQRLTGVSQEIVLSEIAPKLWKTDPPPIPFQLRALTNVGRAAQRSLRRIHQHALAEHHDFLQELKTRIALRVSPKDTEAAEALKTIDRQLVDRAMFSRIGHSLNPSAQSALRKVEIIHKSTHVDPSTGERVVRSTMETIDTRAALETAIIQRNKRHFAQAQGTPFTQPPFSLVGSQNKFSLYNTADGTQLVAPADSFLETQTVLDILKQRRGQQLLSWSAELDFDNFISARLHWKESTSTSPSGRHLGIYKGLVTTYINASGEFSKSASEEDPDSLTFQEQGEAILRLIHGLASKAATLGFYLRRWMQVINIMIYKKIGCYELDQLRVIHLFEADFNLLAGVATLLGQGEEHFSTKCFDLF